MGLLRNPFNPASYRDAVATPRSLIGFSSDGGLTYGVTGTTALGLSAVWRCLDILSNGVSQLDWREVRGNLDLPISRLVRRPMEAYTRREWVSIIVSTLALYDVCYLLKVGQDAEGVPMSLIYVQPSIITPLFLDTFSLLPPREFMLRGQKISRDDLVILHRSPQPGIFDGQGGIIQVARVTFAAAQAAEGYASRYWQAGGPTDRALVSDGAMPDAIAKQNSDRWAERRSKGPDYVPVLTGGMKYEIYGVDPTAEAAVEARREQVADIGRYFGVPTRILNAPTGDSETYHTSEAGNQDLVRYTLQNYISAIQDAISEQLPGGRRMVMDTEPLTRGVQLNRYQAYQYALGSKAWLMPEDVRDMEGLPPVENPDELNPPPPTPVIAAPGGQTDGNQG